MTFAKRVQNSNSSIAVMSLYFAIAACATPSHENMTSKASECIAAVNRDFGTSLRSAEGHETPAVTGDFNGDGTWDVACLGMIDGEDAAQIYVHFRSPSGVGEIVSLKHFSPDVPVEEIRIFGEPPITFTTRCGYMPEDCSPDAPHEIHLEHESIFLAVLDASGILIFWNEDRQAFAREWLLD